MEIITYGAQPNIKITLQSENYSELRNLLFDLDAMSRRVGYLTINDIFNRTGHIASTCYVYSTLGWNGHTCFGNGPIGEKQQVYDGKTVYYYNCIPTDDIETGDIQFKPALPKADKDAKIQKAYNVLTKAYCRYDTNEDDLVDAMGEAIRTLGEVLE